MKSEESCVTDKFAPRTGIDIDKLTNGSDGPEILVGSPVNWTYKVTNTSNVTLYDIVVTDVVITPDQPAVVVDCSGITTLAPGAHMTCTASGTAVLGSYKNTGKVEGDTEGGSKVSDEDPSHYTGVSRPPNPTGRLESKSWCRTATPLRIQCCSHSGRFRHGRSR